MASSRFFHYAGHASYRGHEGWDSVLGLADGSQLSVADILALDSVPTTVVLSGCDTARTSDADAPQSLGLAQAFLAKGAEGVIAASRPVDDRATRDLVASLYSSLSQSVPLAEALRRAQLELRGRNPEADWAAYRLMTP